MSKVYIIPLAISLILGIARAQVSQVDMRIGSLNDFQRNELSGDDNNLKKLDLESYRDVASLESAISPDKYILGPGDELGISIIMGENLTLPTKITPTGDLFIPSVGLVNVSGETLDKARKKGTNTLLALSVIALAVYIGFTPLYELIFEKRFGITFKRVELYDFPYTDPNLKIT